MAYRKFYEEQTGKRVPKTFTVHHINHDRRDSDIMNLVALPGKLHIQYHRSFPFFIPQKEHIYLPFTTDEPFDMCDIAARMTEFCKVREQCKAWINFRNFLLGIEQRNYKGIGY